MSRARPSHLYPSPAEAGEGNAPKVEPKTMIATDKPVLTSVSPFKDNTGGA